MNVNVTALSINLEYLIDIHSFVMEVQLGPKRQIKRKILFNFVCICIKSSKWYCL